MDFASVSSADQSADTKLDQFPGQEEIAMQGFIHGRARSIMLLALVLTLAASAAIGVDARPADAREVAPVVQHTAPTGISVNPTGGGEGLATTMTVTPTNVLANDPTSTAFTYDINVANTTGNPIPLNKVFNGLTAGFEYVAGSTRLGDYSIADPAVDILLFDESQPSLGARTMLTWDISGIGLNVQPGQTVTLSFDAQATNLPDGNYCSQSWTSPDGSTSNSYLTAKVTAGSPAASECGGKDVRIRTLVAAGPNPNENPLNPDDDVLISYTVEIENTGLTDLNLWWLRDKLPLGFDYEWNSTNGSLTNANPFLFTIAGRQRLNWFLLFPTVLIPAGETRTISFDVEGPEMPGEYFHETWAFFTEFADLDAPYSWPSAPFAIASPVSITNDLAVTSVAASSQVVLQGDSITVDITLDNLGGFVPPSVDVTLFDATDGVSIGTQTVLDPCTCGETLTFTWDTTGAGTGTHTLVAAHDYRDQDRTNDVNWATVSIITSPVDVAITSFAISPSTLTEGDTAGLDIAGENPGRQSASGFVITV
ncbi:MAG: hypothetical protein IIC85_03045, partial [Chloroflexi bacterium]|nr:hypothetical protein [Chloroflexota bacterium]